MHSDECGLAYCPDCVPTWVACQFCEDSMCNYNCDCCINICQGEGCNRANCTESECFNDNEIRQGCVRKYEEEGFIHSFCVDCYPGGMNAWE